MVVDVGVDSEPVDVTVVTDVVLLLVGSTVVFELDSVVDGHDVVVPALDRVLVDVEKVALLVADVVAVDFMVAVNDRTNAALSLTNVLIFKVIRKRLIYRYVKL